MEKELNRKALENEKKVLNKYILIGFTMGLLSFILGFTLIIPLFGLIMSIIGLFTFKFDEHKGLVRGILGLLLNLFYLIANAYSWGLIG